MPARHFLASADGVERTLLREAGVDDPADLAGLTLGEVEAIIGAPSPALLRGG